MHEHRVVQPEAAVAGRLPRLSALWPRALPYRTRLALAGFFFLLQALRLSFYRYDLISPPVFNGWANYQSLWENPLFHQSFWVSVKYMFGVSIPEWFLALGLALLLNRAMPGR